MLLSASVSGAEFTGARLQIGLQNIYPIYQLGISKRPSLRTLLTKSQLFLDVIPAACS